MTTPMTTRPVGSSQCPAVMVSRRRFLFVIRSYAPDAAAGSARSTQSLAEALHARGHDVHVLRLVAAGGVADARRAALAAGLMTTGQPALHFQPIWNVYGPYDANARHGALQKLAWHAIDLHNPVAAHRFRKLVRAIRPDVINTSVIDGFSSSIFAVARQEGVRLVHTMRDYYLLCARSGMFRDGQRCQSLCAICRVHATVQRRHARHVDLFLANSRFVAEEHDRFGTFAKGRPVLVQWNVNEHPLALAPRPALRDHIVFGFIGRIAPTKGLESLLEACERQAGQAGRSFELQIAGSGDDTYVAGLQRRFASDRIRFVGWASAAGFYQAIDVLVCPSTYNEPLPRVIYEGYGFALPTVAAASGGIPELVDHEVTGLLYQPGNVAELTSQIARFRTMPASDYQRFSASALAAAHDFTPDAVIARYETRIEALLAGSTPQ